MLCLCLSLSETLSLSLSLSLSLWMWHHRNFTPTEDFGAAMQHIKDTVAPIEFSGSPGDVILYHHLAVRMC